MKTYFAILCLSTLLNITFAFKAAIVEYKVDESEKGPSQIISKNVGAYIEIMEQLRNVDIDIAVFPEYGLTGRVEDPTDYAIPIPEVSDEEPDFDDLNLKSLSNGARTNDMYIVINLLEKTSNKTSKDTKYFNTNIVFNKQGKLVAKYRKINTFHEPKLTKGTEPCTFKAEDLGGAVFGLFTSQDILFENPSISITKTGGLTAVLYPNAWPITLPFYNPISIQHSYVKKTKVPLIGSNLNDVDSGYSGSVIIAGDSTFSIRRLTGISGTNIQAADLTSSLSSFSTIVIPNTSAPGTSRSLPTAGNNDLLDRSKLGVAKNYDSKKYKITDLDLSKTIDEKQCSSGFCCTLKATLNTTSTSAMYKLIVYNGKDTTILNEDRNVKYCVLLSCEKDFCGSSTNVEGLSFTKVEISATFDETDNPLPVSLVTDYDVVNKTEYSRNSNDYVFKTSTDVSHVNVFGFVSTRSGANSIQVSFVLLIVGFILHYVLKH